MINLNEQLEECLRVEESLLSEVTAESSNFDTEVDEVLPIKMSLTQFKGHQDLLEKMLPFKIVNINKAGT